MTESEKIKAIAIVLKKHWSNLSTVQTLDIAIEILKAVSDA